MSENNNIDTTSTDDQTAALPPLTEEGLLSEPQAAVEVVEPVVVTLGVATASVEVMEKSSNKVPEISDSQKEEEIKEAFSKRKELMKLADDYVKDSGRSAAWVVDHPKLGEILKEIFSLGKSNKEAEIDRKVFLKLHEALMSARKKADSLKDPFAPPDSSEIEASSSANNRTDSAPSKKADKPTQSQKTAAAVVPKQNGSSAPSSHATKEDPIPAFAMKSSDMAASWRRELLNWKKNLHEILSSPVRLQDAEREYISGLAGLLQDMINETGEFLKDRYGLSQDHKAENDLRKEIRQTIAEDSSYANLKSFFGKLRQIRDGNYAAHGSTGNNAASLTHHPRIISG